MADEGTSQENRNLDSTCALCGRALNSGNRSVNQHNLCKWCAGDADDPNDDFDLK